MASTTAASRYASYDCRSSTSSHHSEASSSTNRSNPAKVSTLKRLIGSSSACQRHAPDSAPSSKSSRVLARTKSADVLAPGKAKNEQNFGSMVKKLMEKKPKPKLVAPGDFIKEDLKKVASAGKGPNFAGLHKKLFQKAVGPTKARSETKALTEVKENTRTLGMVLRSERELLSQNKQYEEEVLELRLMLDEKNREVDKLKDLCIKQREEIKALKDAILFPDVMNSQLHELLEKQGSELTQAKQMIPCLQRQVSSLTGQLQCLAEDLAEVKADKYGARSYFSETGSPKTPVYVQEPTNFLELRSGDPMTPRGSLEEMFLKDLNPCLTPHYIKPGSTQNGEMTDYDSPCGEGLFGGHALFGNCLDSNSRKLSKSSEPCQRPSKGHYPLGWSYSVKRRL